MCRSVPQEPSSIHSALNYLCVSIRSEDIPQSETDGRFVAVSALLLNYCDQRTFDQDFIIRYLRYWHICYFKFTRLLEGLVKLVTRLMRCYGLTP